MKYYHHQIATAVSKDEIETLTRHLRIHDQDYFPNLSSRGLDINDFIQEWNISNGSMMALWNNGEIIASIGYWHKNHETIYVDWLNVPQQLRMTRVLYQLLKLSHLRESEIAKTQLVTARTWEGNRTVTQLMEKLGLRETHRVFGELCSERVSLYYEGSWKTVEKSLQKLSSKIAPLKRISATSWANKANALGSKKQSEERAALFAAGDLRR